MLSGHWRLAVVMAGLALILPSPLQADTKEERARKKAWEEAQAAFKKEYRSEDSKVRREAIKKLVAFSDLGAGRFVVENVLEK